jgi:hypothetical protein
VRRLPTKFKTELRTLVSDDKVEIRSFNAPLVAVRALSRLGREASAALLAGLAALAELEAWIIMPSGRAPVTAGGKAVTMPTAEDKAPPTPPTADAIPLTSLATTETPLPRIWVTDAGSTVTTLTTGEAIAPRSLVNAEPTPPMMSVTVAGRAVTTEITGERSLVAAATTLSATLIMDSGRANTMLRTGGTTPGISLVAAEATSERTEAGRPVAMGTTSLATAVTTNGSEFA